MVKLAVVHPYHEIIISNTEKTINTYNLHETQRIMMTEKKTNLKDYILHDSIYITCKYTWHHHKGEKQISGY